MLLTSTHIKCKISISFCQKKLETIFTYTYIRMAFFYLIFFFSFICFPYLIVKYLLGLCCMFVQFYFLFWYCVNQPYRKKNLQLILCSNLLTVSQSFNKRPIFFFFNIGFLSRTFTIHWTAGKGNLLSSFLLLLPASETFRYQPDDYCRELTSAQN